jgi:putative transposase
MRYRRLKVDGGTYFFTLAAFSRRPIFRDPIAAALLYDVVRRVQGRRPFEIVAHVLLPDHLHMIWTLPTGDSDFPTRWMLIKGMFTRLLPRTEDGPGRVARRERKVWQSRYWEHLIRDNRDYDQHVDYIHYNPVKHGLTHAPGDWPHSSFKEFVASGRRDPWWGTDHVPRLPSIVGEP